MSIALYMNMDGVNSLSNRITNYKRIMNNGTTDSSKIGKR